MTRRKYPVGVKVSDEQMAELELHGHKVLPKWNYTIRPSKTH